MSDDTPTERFTSPTERRDEPQGTPVQGTERKSRKLIIWLAVFGGLLLIALVIILTLLFARGMNDNAGPVVSPSVSTSATPSASAMETPSPTPSPAASESPSASPSSPPEAIGPRFKSFDSPQQQNCSAGGPGVEPTRPNVTVSWSTAGADEAWYVNGTSDAATAMFMQIPLNGDQGDFEYPQQIGCSTDSATFTITLVGPDGTHVSKTWTVTLTGDRF